jgi:hypothetical protein
MASTISRILNFCIDVFLYFILCKSSFKVLETIGIITDIKWFSIVFYILYYFTSEYFFGKSPAKWITKTKVELLNKQSSRVILILIRSIVRLMPIDLLSYLFTKRGFHDRWSHTQTVSDHH